MARIRIVICIFYLSIYLSIQMTRFGARARIRIVICILSVDLSIYTDYSFRLYASEPLL